MYANPFISAVNKNKEMKVEMTEDLNEVDGETIVIVEQFTSNLNDRIKTYFINNKMPEDTDVAQIPDEDYFDILKRTIFVTFRKQYFYCVFCATLAESFGVF